MSCQFDASRLKKLRPSFKENGGSVTAGNASSIRFPPLPPSLSHMLARVSTCSVHMCLFIYESASPCAFVCLGKAFLVKHGCNMLNHLI